MKTFLVRGVPASIQQDGWWMDGDINRPTPPPSRDGTDAEPGRMGRPIVLLALIALSDVLLWGAAPGVSLALFGMIVLACGLVLRAGKGWGGLVAGALLFIPVIEQAQLLSVLFWIMGMLLGGAWIAMGGWQGLYAMACSAGRLLYFGPLQAFCDAYLRAMRNQRSATVKDRLTTVGLGWAVPLGLGFIFVSLMVQANPIAQTWLERAQGVQVPELGRMMFWLGIAILVWPFLKLGALQTWLTPATTPDMIGPRRVPAILNPAAIRRSLVLFNLIFAAQTGLDLTYLWGGAALPDGMSHAAYAHRGAYPLLLTALLAGAFALVARPFTALDPMMRAALMFWLGQTVLLVISSLMRLELYIEAFGLTRLRLAAGIWMMVVATGLGLTLWQVLRHHSAAWLLKRCAILGMVTLYAAMFLSFDRTIARYNLTHDVAQDPAYICTLGPAALPEIRSHAPALCDYYAQMRAPLTDDWREWGFRDWRVLRSLAALNTTPTGEVTWPTF
ncbi:MAG: DUF4173 domain-containing protein [Roseovarius sp.]